MALRHNFQNISWFFDLENRIRLDLNPPYQRRSVWNQSFKDYFIGTVLLGYPAPAIFLYEDISGDGITNYAVVDGKQRLTTIFEFIRDAFPVNDKTVPDELQGQYFSNLPDNIRREFWAYEFLVEYVPSTESVVIDSIFDRLNRNVAKLSRQELRHAKYDGLFITTTEELTSWMEETLPDGFPRITDQSRRQMKDVEYVAVLLLLLESGTRSTSQTDLDEAFGSRDEMWESRSATTERFRQTILYIASVARVDEDNSIVNTRFRNQADFYSLFGAVADLHRAESLPEPAAANERLVQMAMAVEDESQREENSTLSDYYNAARSASNDKGPRDTRIRIIKSRTGRWAVIAPPEIRSRYDEAHKHLVAIQSTVSDIILRYCRDGNYAFQDRVKTIESVVEKIESGRFERWAQLDDLYACSIIVPTFSHEAGVLNFLKDQFEKVKIIERGTTKKDPNIFRFDATRAYFKLMPSPSLQPESLLRTVVFEVQVKSAFEHAWSVATHAIAYKGNNVDWSNLRLAAQLKASVEQIDGILNSFTHTSSFIKKQSWPEIDAKQHINKQFQKVTEDEKFPKESLPNSWGRFSDNLYEAILAFHGGTLPFAKRLSTTKQIVKKITDSIQNDGLDKYPRTLSLLQYSLCILAGNSDLKSLPSNYRPLCTNAMGDFFPATKSLPHKFELR